MTQPEVGPNDIVIHLVNPYKCGDCGAEFCMRSLFLDHLAEHIDLLKAATPCHQIVCVTSLVEQQSNGITVTRDILQINEEQMFELQDAPIDYSQLTPLKALEQAGILCLPRPLQIKGSVQPKMPPKKKPNVLDGSLIDTNENVRKLSLLRSQQLLQERSGIDVQILNIESSNNIKQQLQESNQINVQHIQEVNPRISEVDTIVQQSLFGDDKIKEDCTVSITNPTQIDSAQSFVEMINSVTENADYNSMDDKAILRRGKPLLSLKGKGNKKGVVCLICSAEFANASVLERHQVVHTGAKPYSCNVCFKEFNDISSHRKHSLIHKRQHRCPVCHRTYLRRTQLLLHIKQHRKKRFIQFGKNFHEVQVHITRNADGQLIQEYNMPILSVGIENSVTFSKADDHMIVKEETDEALVDVDNNMDETSQAEGQLEAEQKKKVIFRCGHCKMLIFTRPTLSRHLIKHTNTRPFQCEVCLKSFHDKADLLHHHKTHTKPVQCKSCLSSFSKVLYLQNHLMKGCPVTDIDSRFTLLPDLKCQCNICQKILKNKANVLRHLRVHAFQERNKTFGHSENEPSATLENMQSSELENLSQNVEDHFQSLHNSVGYHCLICGQEFRFKSFIITHIRMHLNQRPYKCQDCPKSFYARHMLKKHQQNHTRPYKCPACSKTFIRRYLMKDHFKKRHEQEDPLKDITELLDEKLIQCDICGKTMKSFQKSVMLCHIRLHKDVRPFKCKVCCKSFISDNALRKHSLNHSKPYKCHICNKGFSRRYLLTDHFGKKCSKRKSDISLEHSVPVSEDTKECQANEEAGDFPAATVDASTECRPYEAKVITEQDLITGTTTYTCEPCDKRFTLYDTLVRHINTFSKPTSCKYCGQVFEDKHLTISHQRSCLGPSLGPPQKCLRKVSVVGEQQEKVQKIMKDISRKIETLTSEAPSSDTKVDLEGKSIDRIDLSSKCSQVSLKDVSIDMPVESKSIRAAGTLQILKEGNSRLSCPECDRSFNTPRGLKIHASSHVRLFKCGVCDRDFTQISDLRSHAKIHKTGAQADTEPEAETSERTPKEYRLPKERDRPEEEIKCEVNSVSRRKQGCPTSSKILMSVKRGSRKYAASDNLKSSVDDCVSESRLQHRDLEEVSHRLMQSGTRGRPYSCKMCRRRFTEQSGLSSHMLTAHVGSGRK